MGSAGSAFPVAMVHTALSFPRTPAASIPDCAILNQLCLCNYGERLVLGLLTVPSLL